MNVLGVLQFVGVLMVVFGIVGIVVGLVPVSRSRVGDTMGWGVTLLVLGLVVLLALVFAGGLTS